MSEPRDAGELNALLEEQSRYYRAVSGEYEDHAIRGAWGDDLERALDAFRPTGDVLELACGPGHWTGRLAHHAASLTALDGSAEMLAIAGTRVTDPHVRFIHANIFEWVPDRGYDVVFFGFWLSHVPAERFDAFWALIRSCLVPGGRVFFVDDAHRTPEELVYGEGSDTVVRTLHSGDRYRVVKVPHTPAELERRLSSLGWEITVTPSAVFFWGAGGLSA